MNSNEEIENEHQETDVPKIYKSNADFDQRVIEDIETG